MKKAVVALLTTMVLAAAGRAVADNPGFDRPGIAFSTTVFPRGAFSVELGVPDFAHATYGDSSSTSDSLSTNLRAGLGAGVELQLATPVFNYEHSKVAGESEYTTGVGDSTLSIKVALPSSAERFSWAALAGVTFATGAAAFTAGRPQYRLATSTSLDVGKTSSAGLYVGLTYTDSRLAYRLSPNFNVSVTPNLDAYLEVAFDHGKDQSDATLAGGGLAWMVGRRVQLDVSFDAGVTAHAPDLQGGLGISFYFD